MNHLTSYAQILTHQIFRLIGYDGMQLLIVRRDGSLFLALRSVPFADQIATIIRIARPRIDRIFRCAGHIRHQTLTAAAHDHIQISSRFVFHQLTGDILASTAYVMFIQIFFAFPASTRYMRIKSGWSCVRDTSGGHKTAAHICILRPFQYRVHLMVFLERLVALATRHYRINAGCFVVALHTCKWRTIISCEDEMHQMYQVNLPPKSAVAAAAESGTCRSAQYVWWN